MSEIITIRALLVNYKIVISPRSGDIQGGGGLLGVQILFAFTFYFLPPELLVLLRVPTGINPLNTL